MRPAASKKGRWPGWRLRITSRPTSWRSEATASSSRSGQPIARPIDVGGVLGGERVDPEPLRPQVTAAVDLEEVEDARRAGDREDPGGLEDVDRLGDARGAARRGSAAVRGAQHRDRQGDVGLDRLDQVADAGGLRRRRPHDARLGLDQHREALDGLERGGKAGARRGFLRAFAAHGVPLDLPVALLLG